MYRNEIGAVSAVKFSLNPSTVKLSMTAVAIPAPLPSLIDTASIAAIPPARRADPSTETLTPSMVPAWTTAVALDHRAVVALAVYAVNSIHCGLNGKPVIVSIPAAETVCAPI